MMKFNQARANLVCQLNRMADLAHVVGQDLTFTTSGDLAVVVGDAETQQRILHRLLTGPGSYIWQLSYGAGLPELIGSVTSRQQITAIVRAQISYESGVAAIPEPKVVVTNGDLLATAATITYTDSNSKCVQVLNLPAGV